MEANSFPVGLLSVAFLGMAFLVADASAANLSLNPGSGPAHSLITATASGFTPDSNNQYANTGFYVDGAFQTACPVMCENPSGSVEKIGRK